MAYLVHAFPIFLRSESVVKTQVQASKLSSDSFLRNAGSACTLYRVSVSYKHNNVSEYVPASTTSVCIRTKFNFACLCVGHNPRKVSVRVRTRKENEVEGCFEIEIWNMKITENDMATLRCENDSSEWIVRIGVVIKETIIQILKFEKSYNFF